MNLKKLLNFSLISSFLLSSILFSSCLKDDNTALNRDTETILGTVYPSGAQLTSSEWEQVYVDLNTTLIEVNSCDLDTAKLAESIKVGANFIDAFYKLHIGAVYNDIRITDSNGLARLISTITENEDANYEYKCVEMCAQIFKRFDMKTDELLEDDDVKCKMLVRHYPNMILPYSNFEMCVLAVQMEKLTKK